MAVPDNRRLTTVVVDVDVGVEVLVGVLVDVGELQGKTHLVYKTDGHDPSAHCPHANAARRPTNLLC